MVVPSALNSAVKKVSSMAASRVARWVVRWAEPKVLKSVEWTVGQSVDC